MKAANTRNGSHIGNAMTLRALTGAVHWWVRLLYVCIIGLVIFEVESLRIVMLLGAAVAVVMILIASFTPVVAKADDTLPRVVQPPVRGRWVALNSPATKVPSHVRYLGQAFAIDVAHPAEQEPQFGWQLQQRRPEEFSCFGEPIHALADGVVVNTYNARRDHRARTSWPGLIYMIVLESNLRQVAGPNFIMGNHIIVDHGDGCFAAYCHIQRDTITVIKGERIMAGQVIGQVGNSGNTSEPHLHVQLMDRASPTLAAGVPFKWEGITIEAGLDKRLGDAIPPELNFDGVPANGQIFLTAQH